MDSPNNNKSRIITLLKREITYNKYCRNIISLLLILILLLLCVNVCSAQDKEGLLIETKNLQESINKMDNILRTNRFYPGELEIKRLREYLNKFKNEIDTINNKNSIKFFSNKKILISEFQSIDKSFVILKSQIFPYLGSAPPYYIYTILNVSYDISRSLDEIRSKLQIPETNTENNGLSEPSNINVNVLGLENINKNNSDPRISDLQNQIIKNIFESSEKFSNPKIDNVYVYKWVDNKPNQSLSKPISQTIRYESNSDILKLIGLYAIVFFVMIYLSQLLRYYIKLLQHNRDRLLAIEFSMNNNVSIQEALIIMSSAHIDFKVPKIPTDFFAQYYTEKEKPNCCCPCSCNSKCNCKQEKPRPHKKRS